MLARSSAAHRWLNVAAGGRSINNSRADPIELLEQTRYHAFGGDPFHTARARENAGVEARTARHSFDGDGLVKLATRTVPVDSRSAKQRQHRHAQGLGNVHRSAIVTEEEITLADESHHFP